MLKNDQNVLNRVDSYKENFYHFYHSDLTLHMSILTMIYSQFFLVVNDIKNSL